MKKLIVIVGLFVLASCKKETPSTPIKTECICEMRVFKLISGNMWSLEGIHATDQTDCNLDEQAIDTLSNTLGTWRTQYYCD